MKPDASSKPGRGKDRGHGFDGADETMIAVVVLAGAGLFGASRVVAAHPVAVVVALAAVAVLAGLVMLGVARVRDRLAGRRDPAGPGVVIGSVRGGWRLAGRRAFRLPWACFGQHVLIDGPTGRGKTFAFVRPILRAQIARRDTGVFYLDGKGDPVHIDDPDGGEPGVKFDHVFWPEHPERSACWNPLAGPDPGLAASLFAAALYPEASGPAANFYESRAVFAITRVVPAIALTGYGLADPPVAGGQPTVARADAELTAALVTAGVDAEFARMALRRGWADRCETQLAWLAHRAPGVDLARLIESDAKAPRTVAAAATGSTVEQSGVREVTPAALSRVLFGEGCLAALREALANLAQAGGDPGGRLLAGQLSHDLDVLLAVKDRDRAGLLANLHNRLGWFLQPPFDRLCAGSDFQIADVCAGARVAFLLPTGLFPAAAAPVGRVALSQFKNAVLASQTKTAKVGVFDEFHNFISADFAAFLAQSRSRGGAAVMAVQSLAQLSKGSSGASGREQLEELLANLSTVIVTPGCTPADAEHWAKAFGQEPRPEVARTYQPRRLLERWTPPSVRVVMRDTDRFTATEIAELPERFALIRVTAGRRSYPVAKVDVQRR